MLIMGYLCARLTWSDPKKNRKKNMTLGVECSLLESVNRNISMGFVPNVFMETGMWVCFLLVVEQTTASKMSSSSQFLVVILCKVLKIPQVKKV